MEKLESVAQLAPVSTFLQLPPTATDSLPQEDTCFIQDLSEWDVGLSNSQLGGALFTSLNLQSSGVGFFVLKYM